MTDTSNATSSQRGIARNAALFALGAIVIGMLGVTVWPTLYRYDHVNFSTGSVYPVRTHRFTGKTEILRGARGWVEDSNKSSASPLPGDQLSKLDGRLELTTYGWIKANIYNGTDRDLNTVKVELTVLDTSGAQVLCRVYELTSTGGQSLSSSEFIAALGFKLAPGQTCQWRIISATGE